MAKILTKPYKRYLPGTVLTSDQDEFLKIAQRPPGAEVGAAYVNGERMAQLEREGYFS